MFSSYLEKRMNSNSIGNFQDHLVKYSVALKRLLSIPNNRVLNPIPIITSSILICFQILVQFNSFRNSPLRGLFTNYELKSKNSLFDLSISLRKV